jgi:hypothetical protein
MGGILREFRRQSTIARTAMRAILLPNGNQLIPAEAEDPDCEPAQGVHEITPDDSAYGKWLAFAEPGEDPRPKARRGAG